MFQDNWNCGQVVAELSYRKLHLSMTYPCNRETIITIRIIYVIKIYTY